MSLPSTGVWKPPCRGPIFVRRCANTSQWLVQCYLPLHQCCGCQKFVTTGWLEKWTACQSSAFNKRCYGLYGGTAGNSPPILPIRSLVIQRSILVLRMISPLWLCRTGIIARYIAGTAIPREERHRRPWPSITQPWLFNGRLRRISIGGHHADQPAVLDKQIFSKSMPYGYWYSFASEQHVSLYWFISILSFNNNRAASPAAGTLRWQWISITSHRLCQTRCNISSQHVPTRNCCQTPCIEIAISRRIFSVSLNSGNKTVANHTHTAWPFLHRSAIILN